MFEEIIGTATDTLDEMEKYGAYPGAPKKEQRKAVAAKVVWFISAVVGGIAAACGCCKVVDAAYKVAHPIKSIFKR